MTLLPAALLEQSQFHGGPLQHCDGHHRDWHVGSLGENTWYSSLLPVWMNLTDIHWIKIPARVKNTLTDMCSYISLFHKWIHVFWLSKFDDTASQTRKSLGGFFNSWATWWNPRSPSRTGRPRLAGHWAPSSAVEASLANHPTRLQSRRSGPTGSSAAVIWRGKQVWMSHKWISNDSMHKPRRRQVYKCFHL